MRKILLIGSSGFLGKNVFDKINPNNDVHVIKGKVRCNLYTKSGKFIETFDLKENEVAVQIYGTHEYEIIEDAVVIENKNGPYFGIEKDRKRINVKKN